MNHQKNHNPKNPRIKKANGHKEVIRERRHSPSKGLCRLFICFFALRLLWEIHHTDKVPNNVYTTKLENAKDFENLIKNI